MKRGELHPNWGRLIDFCRGHPQGNVTIHLKDGIPKIIREVMINISLDGPDTFLSEPLDKSEVALVE